MQVNPFVIPDSITAKVDQIVARSRARFGHDAFRMEDPPEGDEAAKAAAAEAAAAEAAAAKEAEKAAAAAAAKEAEKAAAAAAAKGEKLEDQPEWVQKMIKELRAENASTRTSAKATAAEEASKKVLMSVLEALGVKGNKAPTLEEVQAELAKVKGESGSTESTLNETKIELAVYRTASKAGGDPDALLDSRTFLEKVKALDISKSDFNDKLTEAIKAAVKENPKLKASQAGAGSSSADHGSGGSGEGGERKPKALTDAVSGHYGT